MIQLVFCPERQILGEIDLIQGIKELGWGGRYWRLTENVRNITVEDEDAVEKILKGNRELAEIVRGVSTLNSTEASAKDHLMELLYGNTAVPRFIAFTLTKGESYTQVEWAETPEEVFNPKRRRKASLAKFFRRANHKGWLNFSEEIILAASEMMGRNCAPDRFSFEEVSGREIYEAYRDGPYSCMAGEEMVRLYVANPEVVSLLKIYDNGRYMGRALIWETDQGKTVLDRIYPSDNGLHIKAAIEYAKANGWIYKTEQSIGASLSQEGYFSVTLRTYKEGVYDKYVHGYPYMDTFRYTDEIESDFIQLNNKAGRYILDSTDGGPIGGIACCHCGHSFPEEEGSWIDGDFYCEDCRDDLFVWSDAEDEFIYREDAVYCEYCDDYHHENNTVYVEYIDESVCERCLRRNFTQCEDCGEWIPDGESTDDLCPSCYEKRQEEEEMQEEEMV